MARSMCEICATSSSFGNFKFGPKRKTKQSSETMILPINLIASKQYNHNTTNITRLIGLENVGEMGFTAKEVLQIL